MMAAHRCQTPGFFADAFAIDARLEGLAELR
jgi:hypothetical protein